MSQECVIKSVCPAPLPQHLGLKGKEEACEGHWSGSQAWLQLKPWQMTNRLLASFDARTAPPPPSTLVWEGNLCAGFVPHT